jgi:uncharacterized protein (TIGR02996 family)
VARDLELLQTIIQNPDDDAPRYIYADWLEEHGNQARAEFIRAQCESDQLFRANQNLERAIPLRAKHTELLRQHGKEWVGELPGKVLSWTFERGFIEYVRMEADSFLKHTDFLFENAPIRRLFLINVRHKVRSIVRSPYLARLSHLYLENLDLTDLGDLLDSRYLTKLSQLDLLDWRASTPQQLHAIRARFGDRVRF